MRSTAWRTVSVSSTKIHIHARRHDLAGVHVAQVQDLVDHALLVIKQIVAVRHEIP